MSPYDLVVLVQGTTLVEGYGGFWCSELQIPSATTLQSEAANHTILSEVSQLPQQGSLSWVGEE